MTNFRTTIDQLDNAVTNGGGIQDSDILYSLRPAVDSTGAQDYNVTMLQLHNYIVNNSSGNDISLSKDDPAIEFFDTFGDSANYKIIVTSTQFNIQQIDGLGAYVGTVLVSDAGPEPLHLKSAGSTLNGSIIATYSNLSTVARTGDYNDLLNQPATNITIDEKNTIDALYAGTATFSNTGLLLKDLGTNTLTLQNNETLTGNHTLSFIVSDSDKSLTISGDADISGTNTGDQDLSGYSPLIGSTSLVHTGTIIEGDWDAGTITVNSNSSNSLVVGPNGATNPTLIIDSSITDAITGLKIQGKASGAGVLVQASGGTDSDEALTLSSLGSGQLNLNSPSGNVAVNASGNIVTNCGGGIEFKFSTQQAILFESNRTYISPYGYPSDGAPLWFTNTQATSSDVLAGTEFNTILFDMASTLRHQSNTALTLQRDFRIIGTTHAFDNAGGVITDMAAVAIDMPNIGTNASATNASGIYIPTSTLSSDITNAYGINISAPSGATNNYAAKLGQVTINDTGLIYNSIIDYDTPSTFTGPPGMFDKNIATHNYVDMTFNDQLYPVVNAFTARLSTTTNLIGTYNNGTAGISATFILTATGVLTIDGKIVALNDKIVFAFQTDDTQNGLYKCTTAGSIGVAAIFTRDIDYDTPTKINGNVDSTFQNQYILITDGNTYKNWIFWNSTIVTAIGSDSISFFNNTNINGFVARDAGIGPRHTPGQLYLADVNGVLQPVTLSGDATINSTGIISLRANTLIESPGCSVDGGTIPPSDSSIQRITMPYDGTITHWYLSANTSGSCTFDIKKNGTSMIGIGNAPTLTSQQDNSATPTSWTSTTFSAGDIIEYLISGATTLTKASLTLRVIV